MQAQIEMVMKRHIQSFTHMVKEDGMSYTAAWEVIKSRTTLGEKSRAELWDRCLDSVTAK